MSRPFTYNDENFTVIGNILFIHAKLAHSPEGPESWREQPIKIPPGITERLTLDHTMCSITLGGSFIGDSASNFIIRIKSNKLAVYAVSAIDEGAVALAYIPLKNI